MKDSARGFTLIEILIVIVMLGALAGITIISFSGQSAKARDVERKSDLRQYQAALETYANRSGGVYPIRNPSAVNITTMCGASDLNLSTCPGNPPGTGTDYQYKSNTSGTKYVIWAFLEQAATNDVFILCSEGEVDQIVGSAFTGVNDSADCPI